MVLQRVPIPVETLAESGTTSAYLIGAEPTVLVDPAAPSERLDEEVASRDVQHVAVTHTHPDHVGAVARYAPGRTVWGRAGYERRFEEATGVEVDRTLDGGDALPAGGVHVEALATPGHAPDHLAFAVGGSVLTGDLVVAEGSVVVGADDGNMAEYLRSLQRLLDRDPDVLYPGHGPPIETPSAELKRLHDHRLARERRVLAAVESGAETPEEIVEVAYDKDLSGVRDLAVSTVVSHLRKLNDDGQIDWNGEGARPV